MRSILAGAAALLLLSGCTTGLSRAQVLNGLVGQPETEAVRVLGVPSRYYETAGRKFLAYTEQRVDLLPTTGLYGGVFGVWGGNYGVYGFPPEAVERSCETTLEVAGGRVQTWSLRGNSCA